MFYALKETGVVRIFLTAVAMWIARLVILLPFLNENGNVPSVASNGRIPANVEYFFSTFIAVMTLSTLLGVYYLFSRPTSSSPAQQGAAIALGLVISVSLLDILVTVVLKGQGLTNWFLNMALDYSPLIFIPVFTGQILQRKTKG